eukprot:scaffold17721_cov154-Skeletonema_menzelii.AAC.1
MNLHFTKLAADTLPLYEKKSSAGRSSLIRRHASTKNLRKRCGLKCRSRVAGKQISGGDNLDML